MRITFTTPAATASFVTMLLVWGPCGAEDTDSAAAAAALFDAYCLSKSPDFAQLDQRATESHYEVFLDRDIPMPDGAVMKQKNWLARAADVPTMLAAADAPIMLTATDVTNGSLHVFGCGIAGPNLNGKTMESALSSLSRLGAPTRHCQVPGGSPVVWWTARVGDRQPSQDSQVMLSYDIPGMPGVSVNLILKTHLQAPAGTVPAS